MFNVIWVTAQEWLGREDVQTVPSCPHTPYDLERGSRGHCLGTVSIALPATRRPAVHYYGAHQCRYVTVWHCPSSQTRRHGAPSECDSKGRGRNDRKNLRSCKLGIIHIDTEYLPQMPDETSRRFCSSPSTVRRAGFSFTYRDVTEANSIDFLYRLAGFAHQDH